MENAQKGRKPQKTILILVSDRKTSNRKFLTVLEAQSVSLVEKREHRAS